MKIYIHYDTQPKEPTMIQYDITYIVLDYSGNKKFVERRIEVKDCDDTHIFEIMLMSKIYTEGLKIKAIDVYDVWHVDEED